jgi:hypothetical protein
MIRWFRKLLFKHPNKGLNQLKSQQLSLWKNRKKRKTKGSPQQSKRQSKIKLYISLKQITLMLLFLNLKQHSQLQLLKLNNVKIQTGVL